MDTFNTVLSAINDIIWHKYVLFGVMGIGVLFTLWSGFCQYRAMTHGVAVIKGKYDDKDDPGAINHFQALSAALSATVGLGNIAGVAVAIALGGPGAVFWMWMIGLVGMALKTTEVSLAMLYRKTDDPENPHGGAMYVADTGFSQMGMPMVGKVVAVIFCITLLISTITGGNMFQAWSVADVTYTNFSEELSFGSFQLEKWHCGLVLALLSGLVIIGGIKRIGTAAGTLVPFMCVLYLGAGIYVLALNVAELPSLFKLIFDGAFGKLSAQEAFLGGTWGYAFLWGLKRALFSSEAGQGSAPIAHSAAKTDEPIREGVVAGLEPFIDTIVVCTLTAMIILSSGAWNRAPEASFDQTNAPKVVEIKENGKGTGKWTLSSDSVDLPKPVEETKAWNPEREWKNGDKIFMVVEGDSSEDTGGNLHRISGEVEVKDGKSTVKWSEKGVKFEKAPTLKVGKDNTYPIYSDHTAASLTSHAFDRVAYPLGRYLVTIAAWLFALSTVISWSYYGEQGTIYLFGERSVLPYRLIYCAIILISTVGIIKGTTELDNLTTLGTGVMLIANLPICLIFGRQTMKAYHEYIGKVKRGEFPTNDGSSDNNSSETPA